MMVTPDQIYDSLKAKRQHILDGLDREITIKWYAGTDWSVLKVRKIGILRRLRVRATKYWLRTQPKTMVQ